MSCLVTRDTREYKVVLFEEDANVEIDPLVFILNISHPDER